MTYYSCGKTFLRQYVCDQRQTWPLVIRSILDPETDSDREKQFRILIRQDQEFRIQQDLYPHHCLYAGLGIRRYTLYTDPKPDPRFTNVLDPDCEVQNVTFFQKQRAILTLGSRSWSIICIRIRQLKMFTDPFRIRNPATTGYLPTNTGDQPDPDWWTPSPSQPMMRGWLGPHRSISEIKHASPDIGTVLQFKQWRILLLIIKKTYHFYWIYFQPKA